MEASAAGRGGPMAIPTQPSRKEWRAVSDHHSVRNVGDEGREPLDVDFCSITIDGSLDDDLLQRRLHDVTRQREELQQIETEIRSQLIARSEIIEMRNSFDAQMKEHANASADFQEELRLGDQKIRDLERKLEEKDRELHAIKLDNEAAWAKEDLLREQNKELANYRRERDHSDAERSQHVKQIHELQEHFQEKERQILDLQDQNRAIQETILYKDEQLREAQAWITRVQEMDALQSTTLQAELRERIEQYNQLWVGCQRQFVENERVHLLAVQQLQLELAEARERSGAFTDESRISQENAKEISQYSLNDGNQLEMNNGGGGTTGGSTVALPNGNPENAPAFASTGNVSTQSDHTSGVAIPPSSIVGMPSYLPPAQLAALHPFVMHQHVPQSHLAHYQSLQQWHNQQAGQDNQISAQNERSASPAEQNLARPDQGYNYDTSVNGQAVPPKYMSAHIGQVSDPGSMVLSPLGEAPAQIPRSVDRGYFATSQTEQELKQISSQFQTALGLTSLTQNNETEAKEQSVVAAMDGGISDQVISTEANTSMHNLKLNKAAIQNATESAVSDASFVSSGQTISPTVERNVEIALLDERSLLACIVRTIPPGGRIRISSTLPNRLGKMLAPLYWHDYKKMYGKLDDFLGSHPELFVIEGDQIQLREGAQKMVAANAAAAKVAAAAATSPLYSSSLPSMAVTPMAQNRPRKQQSQQPNGVYYGVSEAGLTNAKTAAPGQSPVGSSNGRSNSSNFGAKQQGRATGSPAFLPRR